MTTTLSADEGGVLLLALAAPVLALEEKRIDETKVAMLKKVATIFCGCRQE